MELSHERSLPMEAFAIASKATDETWHVPWLPVPNALTGSANLLGVSTLKQPVLRVQFVSDFPVSAMQRVFHGSFGLEGEHFLGKAVCGDFAVFLANLDSNSLSP